jgi:YHYH protein
MHFSHTAATSRLAAMLVAVGACAPADTAPVEVVSPTTHCGYVTASMASYGGATGVSVVCDSTYAWVNSTGIQSAHPMMTGITATNQQVPIAQNFTGSNAWRIPLLPQVAATKTAAVDGPIGIAVNGIPIFNPCKQGGCSGPGGGDTKALGELDLCNGHAGRADDYHYHAAPICLMADRAADYWDTHPLGWALDGYGIFGYRDPDGRVAVRDGICGGNTAPHPNAPRGYAYHVTDVSPYILSCFFGVPSPDLAAQGSKFSPLRPPGTPMSASALQLDASATSLAIGGTSTMSWQSGGRSYAIRYTRTSAVCWSFTFLTDGAVTSSPSYCRAR